MGEGNGSEAVGMTLGDKLVGMLGSLVASDVSYVGRLGSQIIHGQLGSFVVGW